MIKILLIGQCTLHWGRLEFGNIGNYYIIEPLIRGLHETFEDAEIRTTFQLSDGFCEREKVTVLPMELYYGWNETDLSTALEELSVATLYRKNGSIVKETPFIKEVLASDLVIDFSGDIWGDNADFLGPDRFLVGLCKDRVSQLLSRPTFMLAGSPGPFENQKTVEFAKEVYQNFTLVTNREPVSKDLLNGYGFNTSKTDSLACPSFLFESDPDFKYQSFMEDEGIPANKRPKAGFILCGWNFEEGPFDKWPREESEYEKFAETIFYMIEELGMDVCLMSHSNGFQIPPKEFKIQHGRDYPVIKQLQKSLQDKGVNEYLYSIDGVYDPWKTKAIIGGFDFLVSGRVHGAIAGLSQKIPTVIIDYGHEPKAHKLEGFSKVLKIENFVANPGSAIDMMDKIGICWNQRNDVSIHLGNELPKVKQLIQENFKQISKSFFA